MSTAANTQLRSVLGPAKFNFWYETIIDLMIANPDMRQGERARRLGRTQSWLSLIEGSQGFKERYALRRADHSARVSQNIEDKLHNVTSLALDKLVDALEKKDMKPMEVVETTDKLLQRLGYAGKPQSGAASQPSGPMVVQIIAPVSQEVLKSAQTSIRANEEGQLSASQEQTLAPPADQIAGPSGQIDYSAQDAEVLETEVSSQPKDTSEDDPAFRGDGEESARAA